MPATDIQNGSTLSLVHSENLKIPLRWLRTGKLAEYQLPASVPLDTLKMALKGPLAVKAGDYSTGVQVAGLLDDLFYYEGELGAIFDDDSSISIRVWAPTSRAVKLQLFCSGADEMPAVVLGMTETNGVWSVQIESSWTGKYYLFEATVYVPSLGRVVTNVVTDPYSVDLSVNGTKTRLTNLAATNFESKAPKLDSFNDLTIYELHMRDFSASDESVASAYRGTYLAFTNPETNGMRHLRDLARAGMKAIHLLPTFHIASINEDKSTWQTPGDLSIYPPDSDQQQAAIAAVKDTDAYNWGYDPVHYMAPAGAYAFNPDNRIAEYRQMVDALHRAGLRVFQDVVFNHTSASGQSAKSVLDKLVPTYYYRLNADGKVTNSSCCHDTATEHRMMERLMIDTLVMNARHYKIDGFRFDLMSFHFLDNMERIQEALPSNIYLYGEGWTTGETAHNALGRNASQENMYGTGIGTFNDRMRDAIRGGGPFSDQRVQGFATGNPELSDWLCAGLAGNMRDFRFVASSGKTVTAGELDYFEQKVGYTASPVENIAYASVHDNQTLFDAIQIKSPADETIEQRTRRHIVANSLVALAQGIPFFQAGDDLLRSKSMDNNSYNSGDWFNALDFTFQSNNWGIGLPMASENHENWEIMRPLLANPALKPTAAHIDLTRRVFQEFLAIRESSPLFKMRTQAEVQANLHFLKTDSGLIVMRLKDIVVFFNANTKTITFQHDTLRGLSLQLHPIQLRSADAVVRQSSFTGTTGSATVPGLTTAVFSEADAPLYSRT